MSAGKIVAADLHGATEVRASNISRRIKAQHLIHHRLKIRETLEIRCFRRPAAQHHSILRATVILPRDFHSKDTRSRKVSAPWSRAPQ